MSSSSEIHAGGSTAPKAIYNLESIKNLAQTQANAVKVYHVEYSGCKDGGDCCSCSGNCFVCCSCGGGDAKDCAVVFLVLAAVGLAISSFIAWGFTIMNAVDSSEGAQRLSKCRADIKTCEQQIKITRSNGETDPSINFIFKDYETSFSPESEQYQICRIFDLSKKILRAEMGEFVGKTTFHAFVSSGLALLTISCVLGVLLYLNLFASPYVAFCIAIAGGSVLGAGLIGYIFVALTRPGQMSDERFEVQTLSDKLFPQTEYNLS